MSGFIHADGSALIGALNTGNVGQALRVDAQGNLRVATASAVATPEITEDRVRTWIINGQGFSGSTGQIASAAGTVNAPLCIFNPASSGKTILLYSLSLSSGTAGANAVAAIMQYVAVNPGYESVAVVVNARIGGAVSSIAASCTFTSTSQTLAGAFVQFIASTAPIELLSAGSVIVLPAGNASGVTVFMQTYAAGIGGIIARWIEF